MTLIFGAINALSIYLLTYLLTYISSKDAERAKKKFKTYFARKIIF